MRGMGWAEVNRSKELMSQGLGVLRREFYGWRESLQIGKGWMKYAGRILSWRKFQFASINNLICLQGKRFAFSHLS